MNPNDEIIDWPEPPDQKDLRVVYHWYVRKKLNEYFDKAMNPDPPIYRYDPWIHILVDETGCPAFDGREFKDEVEASDWLEANKIPGEVIIDEEY